MQESSVRVTSTANRMGRSWLARLFWLFICLDILLLTLVAFGYMYTQEKAVYAELWQPSIERRVGFDRQVDERRELGNLYYSFVGPDGVWVETEAASFALAVYPFALVLAAFEFLEICRQGIWGARKARKLLRPLDRMAAAARELAKMQSRPQTEPKADPHGGEALHGLEEAIGRIRPDNPAERLETGDIEMQGLERAINTMLSRMHESYRQQAQFVSDASHELRTPIAVIQGYAAMLSRWGKSDPKVLEEGIEAIRGESEYMKKLVEQLLFLARGDTGRNRMEQKRVSLTELAAEACDEARMIDGDHEWSVQTQGDICARADADMCKQLIRILTDNARKYTPKGGAIRLRSYTNSAGEACFDVQDTGAGIAECDLAHIFDRFYRADAARSREQGGTGLGLSIAKWIVDNHGGHFEVLSREGLGTRFAVCLPAWTEPVSGASAERRV